MNPTVGQTTKAGLLTAIDRPSPAKASLVTRREKGPQIVRAGIAKSGLLLKQITDKDHGQASRECDGKERLDFHEMIDTWPAAVWRELIALLAVEFGGTVTRKIELPERAA